MQLVKPEIKHIESYLRAIEGDWSDVAFEKDPIIKAKKIKDIKNNPREFLELFDDPNAKALPYLLGDQTIAYAVPSLRRWIWDTKRDQYCGSVSLRWQNGTTELPYHLMGHIGYCVPPIEQNKGYASFGLKAILEVASALALEFVYLVTDSDNLATQRVIVKNHGILVEQFTKPAMYGDKPALRFLIPLVENPIKIVPKSTRNN